MNTLPIHNYTFRDYIRVVFRRGYIVFTAAVMVTAATYVGLQLHTPYYEASVKMLITSKKVIESPFYRDISSAQEKIAVTQSEIVKSAPVLQRTVDSLGLYHRPLDYEKPFATPLKQMLLSNPSAEERLSQMTEEERRVFMTRVANERLKGSVDVVPVKDTNTFAITVRDFDPLSAAVIANTVSRSYVIFDLEQQLAELQMKYGGKHPQVVHLRDNINKLYKTLDGKPISNADAIGPASVKIIEQAMVPVRQQGTAPKMMMPLALVMGIALGTILAFLFEYLDTTFKIPLDVERYLNIPFIGSIPKARGRRPSFYQNLTEQLYLMMKERSLKTILIAPVQPNGTARACLTELSRYMSQKTARKILLIDANLRTPGLHKPLKMQDTPGVAEVVEQKAVLEKAVKRVDENLYFLPAGRTRLNPLPLFDTAAMRDFIETAKAQYDLVLIYAPQLDKSMDAIVLANYADGIAVMVEEAHTRKEVAKNALQPLEERKTQVIGAILNGRTFPIPRILYGVV